MKKEIIKPDFILIPIQLIADKKLNYSDRILYGAIYWFEHLKDGICKASNNTLARIISSTASNVSESLTRLERNGYIKRYYKEPIKEHRRTQIKALISFKSTLPVVTEGGLPVVTEPPTVVTEGGLPVVTEQNNNSNINKNSRSTHAETAKMPFSAPWVWEHKLLELIHSKQRTHHILGMYYKAKQFMLSSSKELSSAIKRDIRAAQAIEGYDDGKIIATLQWLRENADFKWTLETVHKYINEDLQTLKGRSHGGILDYQTFKQQYGKTLP